LGTRKKMMVVNRKPPHGTIYALEALEIVLIASAFDQDVSVAFIDDGVYQLVKGQDTRAIETKNFSAAYRALPDHDVKTLYVERESLHARGLSTDDLLLPVELLSATELAQRMSEQDVVLSA
jgi:tRNA 2-thiouridine synthesizing protein C